MFLFQSSLISQKFSLIGSSNGGTTITISGSGFSNNSTIVYFGATKFTNYNATITDSKISFITKPQYLNSNSSDVNFTIIVNGIQAVCQAFCVFTYSSNSIPTVTNVFPSNFSNPSIITINGTLFGNNKTDVIVKIGTSNCNVTSVNDNEIKCFLESLNIGEQNVIVNFKSEILGLLFKQNIKFIINLGFGNALSNFTITGTASVQSLIPNSGSIYGGTLLAINGNGFVTQNLLVSIGGSYCSIKSVTLSKIECLTSGHAEGNTSLSIISNSVSFPSSTFYYNKFSSPNVTQISPKSGSFGQQITINGFGFGSSIGNINFSKFI